MNKSEMVQFIMENNYHNDHEKYYESNLAYLQTLSYKELEKMVNNYK